MTARPGSVSLSELVVVFWGFLFVLLAVADFTHGQGRLARHQGATVRLQEARRATALILGRELRALAAPDIMRSGSEELAVRAVRGAGPVCAADGATIAVLYRGVRRPEPTKDSVVIVGAYAEEVRPLIAAVRGGCGDLGTMLTMDSVPSLTPLFALVFEPGSYHAHDGALRYRLGRAGRQPLTEALFAHASFEHAFGGRLHIRLHPDPDSIPAGLRAPVVLPVHQLNGGTP